MPVRNLGLVGLLAVLFMATSIQAAPQLVDIDISGRYGYVPFTSWPPGISTCPCPALEIAPAGAWTGSTAASVTGSAPAAFTIPANAATVLTTRTDTDPPGLSVIYYRTVVTGVNGAGSFQASGGAGLTGGTPVTFAPLSPPAAKPRFPASLFRAGFQGGPEAFGGTMRLLGNMNSEIHMILTSIGPGLLIGTIPLPMSAAGGSTSETVMATGSFVHTTATTGMQPLRFYTDFLFFGFPWTTGTVSAVALTGYQPTSTTSAGYDNRTPMGAGTIQLVTPYIYSFDSLPFGQVGGFAHTFTANLHFTPEPGSVLMLCAGIGLLGALYRMRRR